MENIIFAVLVLGAIAIVFGLILSVAAKVFEVKVDERLPKIQECLAGANCGGCGYPGCAGCAEAILAGKAPVTACAPAGAEGAAKIAAIMGMEAPSGEKMVAHVICNGGDAAVKNFEYVGIADCVGALKVAGGPTACSFGCLGFGSCVAACQFDALHINDKGVAEVDKEKCTNCGACREACPRKLIVEVPYKQKVFVNCANKNKGPAVTKVVCANSHRLYVRAHLPKFDAIHVVNNVAVIDYTKCRNCTMCAKASPEERHRTHSYSRGVSAEKFKAAQKAMAENSVPLPPRLLPRLPPLRRPRGGSEGRIRHSIKGKRKTGNGFPLHFYRLYVNELMERREVSRGGSGGDQRDAAGQNARRGQHGSRRPGRWHPPSSIIPPTRSPERQKARRDRQALQELLGVDAHELHHRRDDGRQPREVPAAALAARVRPRAARI